MYLDHVGNRLAGGENDVHAIVTLRTAIADIGSVILCGLAAGLVNAVYRLLYHLIEMGAAGVGVTVDAFDHDLGLQDIGILPAAAHFESIELRPQHTIVMASLIHKKYPPDLELS